MFHIVFCLFYSCHIHLHPGFDFCDVENHCIIHIQWNLSCDATPFAPEKWPFKRGGLSPGVEIYS